MIIIDLIYNLSVLVALSVLSGFIDSRYDRTTIVGKVLQGFLFGCIAVVGMLYPFVLTKGLIFDGRTIVISLGTLFFGPITGIISLIIGVVYRANLGGPGIIMGLATLISAFLIGVYFHSKKEKLREKHISKAELYLFGFVVHFVMLLLVFILPSKLILITLQKISFAVLGIYPFISLIIAKILLDQEQNKKSFERIKNDESLFRTTLYSIGDAVITSDSKGRIKHLNRIAEKLTGWSEYEVKNEQLDKVFNVIFEESRIRIDNIFDKIVSKGEVFELSNKALLIAKNGKEIPIADSGAPIKDENGNLLGVVLVFRDQTEEREAERNLKESEERFRSIVQNASDIVFMISLTGKISFVSSRILDLLGYTADEIIESEAVNFIHPQDYEGLNRNLEKINTDNFSAENVVFRIRHKNGEWRWISTNGSIIKDENGKVTSVMGIARDISGQKQMEETLLKAKEKAEEMNKIKSNFISNMSHELRTPLIGILGFAQILETELNDKADLKQMAATIRKGGNRLLETLNLILSISRFESLKHEIKIKPHNIIPFLKETFELVNTIEADKNLSVSFESKHNEVICNIDPIFFQNIFNNLLNNAFKFTNVGSITLNVELSGSEVSIKVIDTGIGIEKDRQNIIWEEFRQASEGLSRNYEGTGLGLSIAKKYTDIMNGRISVESEVGKGTVFTVVFPLIQSITKNPLEPENLEGEKEDGLLIHKKKPSILYVEDDPVAIEYVKYILKKFYNLDVANNSQVALSKVNSFTYSAILMDINLRTGLDGLELTKLIKNIPAYKDIPIIAITAYAMENERKEFLEKGLTHYLSKPFEKNELLSILEKIFTED